MDTMDYKILKNMVSITKSQSKINKSVVKILRRQNRSILFACVAIGAVNLAILFQEQQMIYLKREIEKLKEQKGAGKDV